MGITSEDLLNGSFTRKLGHFHFEYFSHLLMCLVCQGLVDHITLTLSNKKAGKFEAELTRVEVIKSIQHQRVRFRGLNLSGLDLSKLVSSQFFS